MPVFLSNIGWSSGSMTLPIEALTQLGSPAEVVEQMRADGFRKYRKGPEGVIALIRRALQQTLSNREAPEPDAVVLAFEDFAELGALESDITPRCRGWICNVAALLAECGLRHAYPYGCWGTGCGNFLASISMASSLVASGLHRRVIVCVASHFTAGTTRGRSFSGSSIISDGAACCIVSSEAPAGPSYGLQTLRIASDARVSTMNPYTSQYRYLFAADRGLKRARDDVLEAFGDFSVYPRVLAPNLRRQVLSISLDALGIPWENVLRCRHPELAHMGAPDHLVGLADLLCSLDDGQDVLVFNPGLYVWNFALFTAAKHGRSCHV